MGQKILLKGKTAFYLFILVSTMVVLTVWITGLDIHRTISDNALYSLTIITLLFFSFVTYGLYKGIGLTDNFGSIKSKVGFAEPSGLAGDLPSVDIGIGEFVSDGIEGIIIGILMWIGIFLLTLLVAVFFENIVFAGVIIFTGLFYWIFYRATRMVLRYSRFTKKNLPQSMWIGLKYSLLYSGWIYLIIWTIELIKK